MLDKYKKTVEMKAIPTQTEIIVGDAPADEIIRYVRDDDLLVMMSHTKKKMERFLLGSVSEKVLRGVQCHIMVLKQNHEKDRNL